ncbi:hypothetical protein D9M68_741300 [compost metagenome]
MGIFRRAVNLVCPGGDFFPGDPADQVLDFALFIGQFVIHGITCSVMDCDLVSVGIAAD